jgi:hypothetical protein
MVNLRTHEARYYGVPGAEEYGAMESAKGVVQEKNYTSTFPLLINLNGRPTYLLSLKDSGGLVKMYAFVDVENYQKVSVTDSSYGIKYAADEYLKMLNGNVPDNPDDQPKELYTSTITIATINNILVDGNTIYYVLSTDLDKYEIPATVDLSIVPFMQEGDTIKVTYYTNENGLNIVTKIQNSTGEEGE